MEAKIVKTHEKDRVRREKLAGYFFDLSKLVFAALVVGGITPLFSQGQNPIKIWTMIIGGLATYMLAKVANRILK